jgi:hypothetical protein
MLEEDSTRFLVRDQDWETRRTLDLLQGWGSAGREPLRSRLGRALVALGRALQKGEPIRSLNADVRAAEIPYAAIDPLTSLDVIARERERSLARLRQLSPEHLERRAVHGELGAMTLGRLMTDWVQHDLSHIRQLVVAAAQPFLPATGPWRPGYTHLELTPKA